MYALEIMLMHGQPQSFHSYLTEGRSNCYINNLSEKTLTENFFLFVFSLAFSITIECK